MTLPSSELSPVDRRRSLLVALGFVICLISAGRPQVVGDGGEYLAMSLNFAALDGPSLPFRRMAEFRQLAVDYQPELAHGDFYGNTIQGRDGRRDYYHFWFYSLAATPGVWVAQLVGLNPIYAFVFLNCSLFLLALWIALPRLGRALSLLLFAGPIVWWLDKAHTEVFTFSLLMIAFVLAREKPWWAMIAAGAASTQYPPILAVLACIGAVNVWGNAAILRDRRFVRGAIAALVLGALHPAYNYVRHGTPSALLRVTHAGGMPSYAEFSTAIADPDIGLAANFPLFALVVIAAFATVARRAPKALVTREMLVVWASTAVFLVTFALKDNVHHGATPSLTRYALWFIPLAAPLLVHALALAGAGWRRAVAGLSVISATVCVFAFHPIVPENSREPIWLAEWLWTKHPSWSNPLPEVFVEALGNTEDPAAPVYTNGCEKILLGGAGPAGVWPIPCAPVPVDGRCLAAGTWCYANRAGATYTFKAAPGIWNTPAKVKSEWVWPTAAEPHVRALYQQFDWPTLRFNVDGREVGLRYARDVQHTVIAGADRFIVVLRDPGPNAELSFRLDRRMTGQLIDAQTGAVLRTVEANVAPGATWEVPVSANTRLLFLAMRAGS